MTQIEMAKQGILSPQMKQVAQQENIDVENLQQYIAEGKVVIPANVNHANLTPCGIGKNLRVKINANIGTSAKHCNPLYPSCVA